MSLYLGVREFDTRFNHQFAKGLHLLAPMLSVFLIIIHLNQIIFLGLSIFTIWLFSLHFLTYSFDSLFFLLFHIIDEGMSQSFDLCWKKLSFWLTVQWWLLGDLSHWFFRWHFGPESCSNTHYFGSWSLWAFTVRPLATYPAYQTTNVDFAIFIYRFRQVPRKCGFHWT